MLKPLLTVTEVGMLAYWLLAATLALGIVAIPAEYMYSDHTNPLVVAWNWSFLPIDVAFAGLGLYSRFGSGSPALRHRLALIAATLMFCAGVMAISYWIMTDAFDPLWWGLNLWLVLLSMANLGHLLRAPLPG
ncbi:DUF5360 family protein [Shimia biformata]|uniref:DUF5360 family protein n=1 Tax=Shimia biformata TaxID=1294299 RepID=UPI00194E2154|nr:DUF5360 family protein [Shimia biformata]